MSSLEYSYLSDLGAGSSTETFCYISFVQKLNRDQYLLGPLFCLFKCFSQIRKVGASFSLKGEVSLLHIKATICNSTATRG